MGKKKVELTKKQRHEIVSGMPREYDYMDYMPMTGWAWEFVRRNEKYIEAFIKLEEKVKKGAWNDECNRILSELQTVASPAGLLIGGRSSTLYKYNKANFLTFELPPYEGARASLNEYFGISHHEGAVPRPEKRYIDFGTMLSIPRKKDYLIDNSFNDLLNRRVIKTFNPDDNSWTTKPDLDRSDEDVFYISVSKHAKITDLKDKLLSDIAKIIKKPTPRVRQRKWKYYLIVYDLKQKFSDKISYEEISKILNHAYPEDGTKHFDETRNINHWYDDAKSLINGGFIKYLKPHHSTK